MSDYCVQLKDGDHKIFPTTLAHCVYDEEGNDLLSLLERLSDNSSVTINELIGEVKKESPNTNIYRRLIALATESKLTVYYTTETAPSTVEVGSLWYNRTEDTVSQFYSGSWTTLEDRNLLDAIKAMNPEYSLGTLDIYVQDREPSDPDEGDVLINGNGIKQYVSDAWSDTTDIRLGGSNIVRYSRDYNPTTYTKWIDSKGATSTNIPVEIEEDKGLSVQRIHGAHVSVSQALKFKPASYYCISAYMKSSDPDNLATIRATVDLSQCSIETSNFDVDEPLTTEYQRYCFVIRTFSTCSYMDCRFESKISNPYDSYGLQIEEGLEYTEWNLNQYDIVETLIRLSTSHEYASNIYYCTEAEVTTPSDHDICYDREDSKVYLYEGGAWIDITDKDLVSSLEYLDIESYSNLGLYVQSSEPTATINGSIWIDRDDNNQMYRWDASHNLWVVVDTSVVANSINKIVQSLSETKTLSGILDGVATRVEETSTLVSEITPEHIISVISNSSIYKDVNGRTLMERMESAESNTTAEHIIDTVTQSTKYSEDLSGKVSTSDFNNLANSVTTTYYGSEEPSNPVMGDMWVRNDSDANRGLWRYSGSEWVNLNDDVLYASMLVAQTATDKANSGIANVDVEYYKSTSSTALVGGSWSTESPAWENGTYIWSRTTTTNGAGQTSQTSPVCITGNTGSQGIPGIDGINGANGINGTNGLGISLINEEYYLSNSNTSQSGGSWVTTLPTWELGRHIWTRSKITYTDDSVSYTDPVYAEDINSNNLLTYCTTAETYIKETEPTSSDAAAKGTTLTNGDLWLKQDNINGNTLYRYIDSAWVLLDVSASITSRVTIKYAELKRLSDSIELKATREDYFDVNGNVKTGLNCASTTSSVKVTPDDVNIYTRQFNVQIPSETDSDGAQELIINKTGVNTTFMTTEDIECPTIYKKYKGATVFTSVTNFTDIVFAINNKILDDDIIINITAGSTIDRSLDLRGITGSGSITVNGNGGDTSVTTGSYITAGVNIIGCDVRVTFNYVFSNFNEERSLYVYYNNCTTSSTFYRTVTKEFTATKTDTLRGGLWMNRPDCFYQGYTSTGLYGMIYFAGMNYESIPQSSTIVSATMTIQRQANYGSTTTVPVTAYASVFGNSTFTGTDHSIPTSHCQISFGSKAYMDVTQFIDHIRAYSTQNCISIYNSDNSVMSGKDYSTNYAKFYGCGTTGVPTISVTYREAVQESSGSTFTSDKSQIRSALGLLNAVYPVGSVYMSVNNVNPSSFIGGTWESIQDQFLVGAGNLYSTGSTGGSSTHNHESPAVVNSSNRTLGINYGYGSTTKSVSGTTRYLGASSSTSGSFSAYVPNTSSSSNLPPYMAVYMWKRTA